GTPVPAPPAMFASCRRVAKTITLDGCTSPSALAASPTIALSLTNFVAVSPGNVVTRRLPPQPPARRAAVTTTAPITASRLITRYVRRGQRTCHIALGVVPEHWPSPVGYLLTIP